MIKGLEITCGEVLDEGLRCGRQLLARHQAPAMRLRRSPRPNSSHEAIVVEGWVVDQPCSVLVRVSENAKTAAAAILRVDARLMVFG